MGKRVIVKMGDIFKITLEDGEHSYCIKLDKGMAFFDYKSNINILKDEILQKPILFTLWVDKVAVKEGGWEKIANDKAFAEGVNIPNYFMWDSVGKKFKMYLSETGEIVKANFADIKDLERAASWAANHIEDRLRDYYLGVENVWVKQLEKPKTEYVK